MNFETSETHPESLLGEKSQEPIRDMALLEQIEHDPDVTQASMAVRLGVAVGTVNWHIKRLIAKGYVKVKRATRRKLRYIITPEGIAFRARLTVDYIEQSLLLYRNTRQRVCNLLAEVKLEGYDRVSIIGEGDLVDICYLTCLEQGIKVATEAPKTACPALVVEGLKVVLMRSEVHESLPRQEGV
jgi:DNA-binding MarR family transcriptional regulator